MNLIAEETLPHFDYEKMTITIEPRMNETRVRIEVEDGGAALNSAVSMSLEDFDRVALVVSKYRIARAAIDDKREIA